MVICAQYLAKTNFLCAAFIKTANTVTFWFHFCSSKLVG